MTHNALSWFVVGLWHDRRTRNSREVRFDIHSLWTVRERGENSRTLDRTVDQIRELTGRKRHRGIGCIALARCRLFDKKKNEAWRNRKTAREQKKVQNEWKRMKKSQRQYGVFYNYTNEPILSAFISWSLNATQVFAQAYDKRTVYISVDHVFHVYTNALMRTARDNCSRKKKKKNICCRRDKSVKLSPWTTFHSRFATLIGLIDQFYAAELHSTQSRDFEQHRTSASVTMSSWNCSEKTMVACIVKPNLRVNRSSCIRQQNVHREKLRDISL